MKFFIFEDYINRENPEPGQIYRPEILTRAHAADDLGGMFGLLPPGSQVPYHYHTKRESVMVCYIAAGEKHTTVNRSDRDFRYLEFFTCPPVSADFVEVK
jgi:hypothetical protein